MNPFTPDTLADRWGVSATTIRNQCETGQIRHFRLGKLYRIPAHVVEEIEECQKSQSDDSAGDTASHGTRTAKDDVVLIRHARERTRPYEPPH